MDNLKDDEDALRGALKDLKIASTLTPKNRPTPISVITKTLSTIAYADGLAPSALRKLLDLITSPSHLDQASLNVLIRNLYPAEKVDADVVFHVIGCLGHGMGKPKFAVQGALVRWLVCVYEVVGVEGKKGLDGAYGVLFNLLDTMQLRAPLCHLLSLITRRKHVRPFRIQMLLELSRKAGHEPALVGLLRVYKDYYPDIIVGDATSGRASVFLHPDREWSQRLADIQEVNLQRSVLSSQYGQNAFKIVRRGVNGSKRGKSSVVPEVRTSNALESSVTLEEISSIQIFIQKLEKIELPNQLVSVMGDPALQKLLHLKSSDATLRRVDYWLKAFFEDHLAEDDAEEETGTKRVLEMLEAIRGYVRFSKVLPPACLNYLRTELKDWNGVTGQEVILDLLSYLSMESFKDLYQSTIQPLEFAILDATAATQVNMLGFYTSLLRHWITLLRSQDATTSSIPLSATTIPLIEHANRLALALLANHNPPTKTGPSHPLTESKILDFLSTTTLLFQPPTTSILPSTLPPQRITVPQATLIYTLHFSPSTNTLSRLYTILSTYKRAFEHQTQFLPSYPKEYVNNFNSFLMDISNCLWRSKGFNYVDPNAQGCLLPSSLSLPLSMYVESLNTGLNLQTLFDLSCHSVWCRFSIGYVREVEDAVEGGGEEGIRTRHAGPVTQKSLAVLARDGGVGLGWLEYRLGVLGYLESRGLGGVGELMRNTMKNLMAKK